MNAAAATHRLHVERTNDPATIRWVRHDDKATWWGGDGVFEPAPSSSLADMIGTGELRSVVATATEVLVTAAAPDTWPVTAPAVHRALTNDLAHPDRWGPDHRSAAEANRSGESRVLLGRSEARSTIACANAGVSGSCHHCPAGR